MKRLRKSNKATGGFLCLLLTVLSLFSLRTAIGTGQVEDPLTGNALFIEVAGDIPNPGVLRFPEPVPLKSVMNRAGFSEAERSLSGIELDTILLSGTRLEFSKTLKGLAVERKGMSSFYRMTLGIPVHLNNTSADGLTAIPGIGPCLAASIVGEREKRQGFRALEELTEVNGISRKLFKKIRPFLVL